MMLNTDVELVFDLKVDRNGEPQCEPQMNGCDVAATKDKVVKYAGVGERGVYFVHIYKPLLPDGFMARAWWF